MSIVLIVFLVVVGLGLLACVALGCSALRMAGLVAEDERRQEIRDWAQPNPRGDLR